MFPKSKIIKCSDRLIFILRSSDIRECLAWIKKGCWIYMKHVCHVNYFSETIWRWRWPYLQSVRLLNAHDICASKLALQTMEEHKTLLSLDVRYYADSSFRSATVVYYELTRLLQNVLANSALVYRSSQGFHNSEVRTRSARKYFWRLQRGFSPFFW